MPRFILIDRHSGYIFGDTADYAAGQDFSTPAEAAVILHRSLMDPASFEACDRHDDAATYDVYRADVNGSEAVGIVTDGQDAETIAAVESSCDYVESLRRA